MQGIKSTKLEIANLAAWIQFECISPSHLFAFSNGVNSIYCPLSFCLKLKCLCLAQLGPEIFSLALAEEFLLEPITKSNGSLYRIFK